MQLLRVTLLLDSSAHNNCKNNNVSDNTKSLAASTVTDLHFLLAEANNGQSLHHDFPIILVTDGAESGTVTLSNKLITHKHYSTVDGIIALTAIHSPALPTPWPNTGISEGFFPGPELWAGHCLLHPGADRRCGSSSPPGFGVPHVISPTGSLGCDHPLVPPGRSCRKR